MHLILCDEINSGKSSYCMELVPRLIDRGVYVSGWVTPAYMEGGKKCGHDFVAINGGKIEDSLPFTRLEPFSGSVTFPNLSGPETRDPRPGKSCPYYFNPKTFARARLFSRVSGLGFRASDFFVMDEIGPLELFAERGFYESMSCVLGSSGNTLTVVRKGLCDKFIASHRDYRFEVFSIAHREDLNRTIFSILNTRGL